MKAKEEMTREEKIEAIIQMFGQLSPDNKEKFIVGIELIASKSLENAPDCFKAFLQLPENEEFAKEFH